MRLPAKRRRVLTLLLSKYFNKSTRRNIEDCLIVIGNPNHDGLEFSVGEVNSKNSDSVDKHHKKFDDRHEALKIVEILVNRQYHAGDKYFFCTYNCDDEVIYGNYSKTQIMDAIEEYISLNYNKKIKPLLNMRNSKGKLKFTHETAHKHIKDLIVKMYLP